MQSEIYKFLFIMDPYSTLNMETETSLLLMQELLALGQKVYWVELENLYLSHHRAMGVIQEVCTVEPFQLLQRENVHLEKMDCVVVRKDPPFDLNYLHLTFILKHVSPKVLQINQAEGLREINEKLFPLEWPEMVPESVTTMSAEILTTFMQKHEKIIVKPLEDCSGRGISLLRNNRPEDKKLAKDIVLDSQGNSRFVTAQVFLEAVNEGDKRVILINGKPVGMVNRIPQKGNFLANIHQGAVCVPTTLTSKEKEMIEKIAPFLIAKRLFIVGLDLIGEKITEINITSPSAIRQINEVSKVQLEKEIVRAMIDYLEQYKQQANF